jgi:hypothetical protein
MCQYVQLTHTISWEAQKVSNARETRTIGPANENAEEKRIRLRSHYSVEMPRGCEHNYYMMLSIAR